SGVPENSTSVCARHLFTGNNYVTRHIHYSPISMLITDEDLRVVGVNGRQCRIVVVFGNACQDRVRQSNNRTTEHGVLVCRTFFWWCEIVPPDRKSGGAIVGEATNRCVPDLRLRRAADTIT